MSTPTPTLTLLPAVDTRPAAPAPMRRPRYSKGATTTTMITTMAQLRDEMARAAGSRDQWLGVILTWDLSSKDASGKLVTMPTDELAKLLRDHNLAPFARSVGAVRMNRAIVRTLEGLAREGLLQAEKVDRSTNTAQRAVYHLLHKEVDPDADELTYRTATKVIYDKQASAGNEVEFIGPLAERVLRPLFEGYRTQYLMSDVSEKVILPAIQGPACGIKLRRMGGTYFIPGERLVVLDDLAGFLMALSERYRVAIALSPFPVVDNPISRDSMGAAALTALLSDLRELDVDLRELEGEGRREKVAEKTARRYDEEVSALLEKATVLTRCSSLRLSEVEQACAGLRARLRVLAPKLDADNEDEGRGRRAEETGAPAGGAEMGSELGPGEGERAARDTDQQPAPPRRRGRKSSGDDAGQEGRQDREGREGRA